MFNRICKFVIAVVIIGLVGFGIFKILPGQYRNGLIQTWQSYTDKNAKEVVQVFTNAKVGKTGVTYKQLFDTNTSNPSYIVTTINETSGDYQVEMYGYKVALSLIKDDGSGDNQVYTNAHLKVVLTVTHTAEVDKINSIQVYINDELQNDHFKNEVFSTLAKNVSK